MKINGFFGHGGNILGYNSAMFYLSSRDATIIVLANAENLVSSRAFGILAGLAFYLFREQFPTRAENVPTPEQ